MDQIFKDKIIKLVSGSFNSHSIEFSVETLLGSGVTSVVFLTKCSQFTIRSDKLLAVKVFQKDNLEDLVDEVNIYRRLLKQINHQFILKAYGYNKKLICLEYISSTSIKKYILMNQELPPTTYMLVFTLAEVSEAISMLHAIGIIHQDIKADNILIRENGHLTICDFGSASVSKKPMAPFLKTIHGSSIHLAPEIGESSILYLDHSIDYYALGVLICSMVNCDSTPNPLNPSYDYNSPLTFAFIPISIRKTVASLMNPNKNERMCNDKNGNVALLLESGVKSIFSSKFVEYLTVNEMKKRIKDLLLETPFN